MFQVPRQYRENKSKLAWVRLKRNSGIDWEHFGIENVEGLRIDPEILRNFSKGWRKFGSVTSINNILNNQEEDLISYLQ